MVINNFLLFF